MGFKEREVVFFRKDNIPKNQTPYLFPFIFSSGVSDAAQFGCSGDFEVTSSFGLSGKSHLFTINSDANFYIFTKFNVHIGLKAIIKIYSKSVARFSD